MKTNITNNLAQSLAQLNPAQRAAVETIDGPLMVLAGPGTGKTQVLTLRIAQILTTTDNKPGSILGLTYTDSAAHTMRERLVELIGEAGYKVELGTFHSFCSQVMREHPELFPVTPGSEPISDWESYSLVTQILEEQKLSILRPINAPLLYVKDIIQAISDLKAEGIDVDAYQDLVKQQWAVMPEGLNKTNQNKFNSNKAKNEALVKVYRLYQEKLHHLGRHDFNDMIAWTLAEFDRNSELLAEYQERFLYILVDEYQDTNSAQNRLVDQLSQYWGEQANLCVVGDPNQAIYRFQGASLENTLGFVARYPQATIINLTQGYRCTQHIYDLAAALIRHQGHETKTLTSPETLQIMKQISQPLESVSGQGEKTQIISAMSDTQEYAQIIGQITQQIDAGSSPGQMAVLCRTNAEAARWHDQLLRANIPAILSAGRDVLQDKVVGGLLALARYIAAHREGQETGLHEVLYLPWLNLPQLAVMKLSRIAARKHQNLWETFLQIKTAQLQTQQLLPLEIEQLDNFFDLVNQWGAMDYTLTLPEWFAQLMAQVELLTYLKTQSDRLEQLHTLNTFFGYVKSYAHAYAGRLSEFLAHLQTLSDHKLSLKSPPLPSLFQAVEVLTAHGAKGREWNSVWVVGLADKVWGNRSQKNKIELPANILRYSTLSVTQKDDDERRLLYVALTRARNQLFLSYSTQQTKLSRVKNSEASQFWLELNKNSTDLIQDVSRSEVLPEDLEIQLQPQKQFLATDQQLYFQKIVKTFALSSTSLDKYLRDRTNFIFDVLLRFPKAKLPVMAYGSAVHSALEVLYRQVKEIGQYPPIQDILAVYETSLQAEVLTPEQYAERLEQGQTTLRHYFNSLPKALPQVVEIERFFGQGMRPTVLGPYRLSGRIDRIDWLDQKKLSALVIDYKTAQAKSLKVITGETTTQEYSARELALPASIRGSYKRQLVFYKLLCELDPTCPYHIDQGEFIFLGPCYKGELPASRRLNLSDDDVSDLKKLIKEVMLEINNLEFLQDLPVV